jgi:hypothetical protein
MWGGSEDALPMFLERGYWYCWDATTNFDISSGSGNSVKVQQERFSQIQKGDRIAVKKILSMQTQEMEVRAIGIVKAIDLDEWRIYVDWLPIEKSESEISRRVALKGCTASVHGPYKNDDPWISQIFCV